MTVKDYFSDVFYTNGFPKLAEIKLHGQEDGGLTLVFIKDDVNEKFNLVLPKEAILSIVE